MENKTKEKPNVQICHGCHEMYFINGLCYYCFREHMAIVNNECIKCGGKDPLKEFWGQCQKCWDKKCKECDDWNKKHAKKIQL